VDMKICMFQFSPSILIYYISLPNVMLVTVKIVTLKSCYFNVLKI
jgi:hypothetical protein